MYRPGLRHQQISQIYEHIIRDVRAKVVSEKITGRRLAEITGLSEATVRRVRDESWRPTIETALVCERELFRAPETASQRTAFLKPDVELIGRTILGVDRRRRDDACFTQFIINPALASVIEPKQLGPVVEYLSRRDKDEALSVTCAVARNLSPNCAVHLFVADGKPENYFAEIWDNRTGYMGGEDLHGIRLRDNRDPLYVEAMIADYFSVVQTGRPRFSAIERQPTNDEPRSFLRFMQAFPDTNGIRKIVIVTAPQEPGFCLDALGYLLTGGPQEA